MTAQSTATCSQIGPSWVVGKEIEKLEKLRNVSSADSVAATTTATLASLFRLASWTSAETPQTPCRLDASARLVRDESLESRDNCLYQLADEQQVGAVFVQIGELEQTMNEQVCMCVYAHTCADMYICVYIHKHNYICTCIYVKCICLCICVYTCVCIYIYIHITYHYVCVCMYTPSHPHTNTNIKQVSNMRNYITHPVYTEISTYQTRQKRAQSCSASPAHTL